MRRYIPTCEPASHLTISGYLDVRSSRDRQHAWQTNWFSVEIHYHSGKRTYHNSFITDLPVTADKVVELAARGRT